MLLFYLFLRLEQEAVVVHFIQMSNVDDDELISEQSTVRESFLWPGTWWW